MITSTVNNPALTGSVNPAQVQAKTQGRGMDSLGQGDFLKLLTVQMQQQDPFDPVDNKEMLAQMAQFSSLAASAETNSALERIASKLDQLIASTEAAKAASEN